MVLRYYYNNPCLGPKKLCTEITADYAKRTVEIVNYTDNLLCRAFGIDDKPSWKKYEDFLRSRCPTNTRIHREYLLDKYGLINYDVLVIIQVTKGKSWTDHMELEIEEW